jgi:hypothetical protein
MLALIPRGRRPVRVQLQFQWKKTECAARLEVGRLMRNNSRKNGNYHEVGVRPGHSTKTMRSTGSLAVPLYLTFVLGTTPARHGPENAELRQRRQTTRYSASDLDQCRGEAIHHGFFLLLVRLLHKLSVIVKALNVNWERTVLVW